MPDFIQFFSLILIAFVVALVARRFKIPYALALVATGLAVGATGLLPNAHLSPATLLTVFLPPLLFESAIQLRAEALRKDWLPITVYSFAGTILSTFVIGGLMARFVHVPLPYALIFGALISATDPISVIAVFKRLGADRRLTLIMEAESLFNDNVAIVLVTVLTAIAFGGTFSFAMSLLQFSQLFVGGAVVGTALGFAASRIHYEVDDHLVEITLTSVVAFGSYLVAERFHFSGVMAVIAAGLVVGNYGMPRTMSASTRLAVSAFWEYAVFVVNSLVFLLIGIEIHYVHWPDKILPALVAIGIVLVGRSAMYPLSFLLNRVNGRIPASWQHVLWWGSLRGALSMALALNIPPSIPQRSLLVAATFGVVLFSLLVQGMSIGPLLKRLGLVGAPAVNTQETRRLASDIMACEAALSELNRLRETEAHPNWAIELIVENYRSRLSGFRTEMAALQPDYFERQEEQAIKAREAALSAEKSAYQEAQIQGWLTEAEWGQIRARIDAELVEVSAKHLRTDDG